jgi:hypothetical protein
MRKVLLAALAFAAVSAATAFAFNPDELNKITFDSINDFRLRRLTSVFIAGWPLWVRAA